MSGTTTTSHDDLGLAGGARRDAVIQFNKVVADLETIRSHSAGIVHESPGLAIHGAASALAKNGTAFHYSVPAAGATTATPTWGKVAANTDWAALSGTVTHAKFNVFVLTVKDDGTGTQTKKTTMGTEAATRAAVVFPVIPADEAVLGYIEINPTGTGNFVGGTTVLDDATVVPNAAYVNLNGTACQFLRSGQQAADLTGAKIGDDSKTALTV